MAKIKTSEATGAALDWLVARCEDLSVVYRDEHLRIVPIPGQYSSPYAWSPTYDWSQGGPIIERERIRLEWQFSLDEWSAHIFEDDKLSVCGWGQATLIAAMRCYVASKLGDTVDIPEELVT